ncbi:class I adenylate-forming enzyme family protein [Actinokineospora sp. HUAS TT18]|uniref:class I adenylate-forming enzyme family protein n=1 Tax=Actinokineospora sp. HUAS TT18 TaxID=3447451 RepID=UPI003F527959
MSWVSTKGLRITDLVPAKDRREWVERGFCPGRDLYSLFLHHVRADPTRDAVIDPNGTLSYAELNASVTGIAADLTAAGLGARDVIGIRLPNGRDTVAAELAVLAIGAVALPFPGGKRDTPSLLGRARASALITDAADGSEPADVAILTPGGSEAWSPVEIDPEAPARILVSSGSESEPKMVAYSHNAFGARANYVRALGTGPMRNLVLVPLASSFGSCGVPVTVAALGQTLIVRPGFDAGAGLRMISEHRPTHVFGVPTMLQRMADQSDRRIACVMVSSGAALPETTRAAVEERLGRVITVYGSADGVNCHTARHSAGVGRPDPTVTDIQITDTHGNPVPPGVEGEIRARGPMTPLCYVAAPDLDARYRTPDGWVRTGDLGVLDDDGLRVVGRIKQVVIRGGHNISPAEVEGHIGTHPAVAEVACVGVPDDDLGERLCAFVAQRSGSAELTLPDLTAFLHDERGVEKRKLPELLVVLPELPLGPTGKICRRTLTAITR